LSPLDQRTRLRAPPPNSPKAEETAAYVASFSGDLRELARRSGLTTLAYLLDMARLEAEAEIRARENSAGSSGPEAAGR